MYKDLIKEKTIYSLDFPKTTIPTPDKLDYESGFIERYFAQKVNDSNGFVFEIDLKEYTKLSSNPYWLIEKMKWRIIGPIHNAHSQNGILIDIGVYASNLASISIIKNKIKNINLYLPNPLQFHK